MLAALERSAEPLGLLVVGALAALPHGLDAAGDLRGARESFKLERRRLGDEERREIVPVHVDLGPVGAPLLAEVEGPR